MHNMNPSLLLVISNTNHITILCYFAVSSVKSCYIYDNLYSNFAYGDPKYPLIHLSRWILGENTVFGLHIWKFVRQYQSRTLLPIPCPSSMQFETPKMISPHLGFGLLIQTIFLPQTYLFVTQIWTSPNYCTLFMCCLFLFRSIEE